MSELSYANCRTNHGNTVDVGSAGSKELREFWLLSTCMCEMSCVVLAVLALFV